MKETLFDADGITVFAEDGKVYEADGQNIFESPDTEKNRNEFIEDAKRTVSIWKAGK